MFSPIFSKTFRGKTVETQRFLSDGELQSDKLTSGFDDVPQYRVPTFACKKMLSKGRHFIHQQNKIK
jgi:hypothetical protein